jgi:hypothetical protein
VLGINNKRTWHWAYLFAELGRNLPERKRRRSSNNLVGLNSDLLTQYLHLQRIRPCSEWLLSNCQHVGTGSTGKGEGGKGVVDDCNRTPCSVSTRYHICKCCFSKIDSFRRRILEEIVTDTQRYCLVRNANARADVTEIEAVQWQG